MPTSDVDLLRQRHQRITPQRLWILEIVRDYGDHISAEAIHEQAVARYPYLSQATVYRTLQWLQAQALVSVIDLGDGRAHYEYRSTPHHHLVCTGCNAIVEVDDAILNPLKAAVAAQYDFAVDLDHLAIFGLCAHCRAQPG